MEINFGDQAKIVRIINSCTTLEQIELVMMWVAKLDYRRFKTVFRNHDIKNELYQQARAKYNSLIPDEQIVHLPGIQYILPGLAIKDC